MVTQRKFKIKPSDRICETSFKFLPSTKAVDPITSIPLDAQLTSNEPPPINGETILFSLSRYGDIILIALLFPPAYLIGVFIIKM